MIPKVSIIVPFYNAELTLEDCIKSILKMDFEDYEVILVDDGSKDKSLEICNSWEKDTKIIKTFHQHNRGPSAARNRGLEMSTGTWVMFVDADDTIRPSYISDLLAAAKETPETVMAVSGEQVYRNGIKAEEVRFPDISCKITEHRTIWLDIKLHKYGHPFGKLYRKDIIEKNHLKFNESVRLGEDCIFMMDYIMASANIPNATISFISKTNYNYVVHPGSLSTQHSSVEQEFLNYEGYKCTVIKMKETFHLDEDIYNTLYSPCAFYIDKILNSIADLPSRKERIEHLKLINRKEYKQFKKTSGYTSNILKYLLVSRFWLLYDSLRANI